MAAHSVDDALAAFHEYLEAYFTRRDATATIRMLSEQFTGVGTAVDEFIASRDDAVQLYSRDIEQATNPFAWRTERLTARALGGNVFVILGWLHLTADVLGQPWVVSVRTSNVFAYRDGAWFMEHMHLSEPAHALKEGEAVPLREMTERNRLLQQQVAERTAELQVRNAELEVALANVETLSGMIPVCAWCRKVRDDAGFWESVERYVSRRTNVDFTHGICPDCESRIFKG